ncbi:MAG: site-specific DNA-methyltransferase [Peptostreptococcales bacterium]
MKTKHEIFFKDARNMSEIKSESVDLMITSPPYPMIKMWDNIFSDQNEKIKVKLNENNGESAFELMHKELDKVWAETYRVLKKGGIACINIGDATRTINDVFKIYPNHARIINYCLSIGFHTLPEILWIKETNKPDKFMGSGMLPVGAYVTLEHEYILILRKNGKRKFNTNETLLRQKSAFFWEERNVWFSDKWKDIKGITQELKNNNLRNRSGAYPLDLVYRLINMFSIEGDVVLDPFLGTGTTTLGSILCGRNSIGYEIDSNFTELIRERIRNIVDHSEEIVQKRLNNHNKFIEKRKEENKEIKYINKNYNIPVITRQEINLKFPNLKNVLEKSNSFFEAEYN